MQCPGKSKPRKRLLHVSGILCILPVTHHTLEPLHKVESLDCCPCGVAWRRSWLPEQANLEEEAVGDNVLAEDTAMRSTCPEIHGQTSTRSVYAALELLYSRWSCM